MNERIMNPRIVKLVESFADGFVFTACTIYVISNMLVSFSVAIKGHD